MVELFCLNSRSEKLHPESRASFIAFALFFSFSRYKAYVPLEKALLSCREEKLLMLI